LTKQAFAKMDLSSLSSQLLARASSDLSDGASLMDLSAIEQLKGNLSSGIAYQKAALERCNLYTVGKSKAERLRLLVIAAPVSMGGNTPIEFLVNDSDVEILTTFIAPDVARVDPLPEFDLAFVAAPADCHQISKLETTTPAQTYLWEVERFIKDLNISVINKPQEIFGLDRDRLPAKFKEAEKLIVPDVLRCNLDLIARLIQENGTEGFADSSFPFVIRPIGSHAGYGLKLILNTQQLCEYLTKYKFADYFISPFIDYRSFDGLFRKYRIVFIDGKAYPCHMAIGKQWKLWYMNAGMNKDEWKRKEEEAFMSDFENTFASRHQLQLDAIADAIGLEYFGIDCGVDRAGNLVVFEADNALLVHDMDPVEIYPYKRPAMHRIFDAFTKMLFEKAGKFA
ncbi:MAG: hypothetical protein AAGF54_08805, partial [Pseudomonadota bacterium]